MRIFNALTLTAALSTTVACGFDDVDLMPKAPGVPIGEPIEGDLERVPHARGCTAPEVEETWTYAWEGDRLQSAAFVGEAPNDADNHAFTYDDAGHLIEWTRGTEAFPVEMVFTRDDAGALTQWTHAFGNAPLTVTITRDDDAVELHLEGSMFLGFETPLLIDLDRIDADLSALSPRLDLILPHLERQADAQEDDTIWDVLSAFDGTQRTEQTAQGETTTIDIDGDGAPDVIEQVTREGGTTRTTVDYAGDARIDVAIEALPGRTERVEFDATGLMAQRVLTEEDATHIFVDQLDDASTVLARTSLFLDANGARLLKYEDENADGLPNWRKRYINDPVTGFRVLDETDGGASGFIDWRREYERDAEGRVLRATLFDIQSGDCGQAW